MAQWSEAMKLKEVAFFQGYLSHGGVYELGFVGGQGFDPMYIGISGTSLYLRLSSYFTSRCHNPKLAIEIRKQDEEVWCHVARTDDPGYAEARMLYQQEAGGAGQYPWNRTYERGGRRGGW